MGCDIHAYLEVKVKVRGTKEPEWVYYAPVKISRDYHLFSLMANVRNSVKEPVKPIVKAKGFPKNASLMTRMHKNHWNTGGHSHSWLSSEEIVRLKERLVKDGYGNRWKRSYDNWRFEMFGIFLFGGSIEGFLDPRDKDYYPKVLKDVRLVFWFDN